MQSPAYGERLKKLFRRDDLEWEEVQEAIGLIKKTDAIERCVEKARSISEEAILLLDVLEDSVYKRSLINLSRYIVDRNR